MAQHQPNFTLEDMDRMSILHPATSIADHLKNGPRIMMAGNGVMIRDQHGKELVDCGAGLWCVNVGYGRAELGEVAAQAMQEMGYFHMFLGHSNEPAIRLADKLMARLHESPATKHLSKVFFGTSGSDANDTNFKLARYYNNLRGKPQKKKFISRLGAYHGQTFVSGSLTGIPSYHKLFDLPISDVLHTSCPHYYRYAKQGESEEQFTTRMIAEVKDIIAKEGADNIAAFIAEPIMGTGGVFLPPKGYFKQLQAVLAENDILFVADEVITGFGRTGVWFASELYDLKPDFLTLAKGITSAYFPVSASVISERVWDVLRDGSPANGPMMHGFTYSGHPVGGAVGLKTLEIIEREDLVGRSKRLGQYFLDGLKKAVGDNPYVGEIRGEGLMIGVEFTADRKTRKPFPAGTYVHRIVAGKAIANGVLVRPLPFIEVISFSPALTISEAEIDRAIDGFKRGLDAAMPDLAKLAAA